MKTYLILIISSLLFACSTKTENHVLNYQQQLDSLENSFQKKLDTGNGMLVSISNYNFQLDSMLNIVYQKLKSNLPKQDFENLKQEQIAWLKVRDFKIDSMQQPIDSLFKIEEHVPTELRLSLLDKKAEFVKKRLELLIKKLHTTHR